ncbi:MAG TPA: GGDEF domain-containing protein [Streptosporangiaceae bacterium]|jgi:diguanylate cyclase (GGDEF)-like protein
MKAGARWVRRWPLWAVRPALLGYILTTLVTYAASLAVAWAYVQVRASDVAVFAALLGVGAISVELGRRVNEPQGTLVKDLFSVWYLPISVLLPPAYALSAAIPLQVLSQWRMRSGLAYRRAFSTAAVGLGFGAASVIFHGLTLAGGLPHLSAGLPAVVWVAAVVGAGAARLMINVGAIAGAIRLSDPGARLRDIVLARDVLSIDVIELTVAVMVTTLTALSPVLMALALPAAAAMRRTALHAQLSSQARKDAKTGLLNAATWQREAAAELGRATRTHTPAALAMLDIDHFKQVNDGHGHQAGDAVLASLSAAMSGLLREYDITGRYGGEEFAILLPHTDLRQAGEIAERLRHKLAQIVTFTGSGANSIELKVTVSIGVATVDHARPDLDELVAAADAALYSAKRAGRDQVHLAPGGPLPPGQPGSLELSQPGS